MSFELVSIVNTVQYGMDVLRQCGPIWHGCLEAIWSMLRERKHMLTKLDAYSR